MEQTLSDRLDTVADVAAAIEAAGNEITDLRVAVDDDGGRGTAHVALPIVDERVDPACEFDLAAATLEDGTLRIELDVDVATETPATAGDEAAPPEAAAPETTDGDGVGRTGDADGSTSVDESPSAERDATRPVDADSSAASAGDADRPVDRDSTDPGVTDGAAASTAAEAAADSDAPASDTPPAYRDPDRLAAVYDPEATFAEMTDALGVDVTPQTVRKYMIEHGIHEPASRASDALAETDEDTEAATSVETRSERDAETTEPEADESDPSDDTAATDTRATAQTGGDEPNDATADPPNTSTADDSAPASTATDGGTQPTLSAVESLELPGEVSAAELVSVLSDSRTVYEVRRGLGVDDGRAREILREYDLIDLVTGRITQGSESPDRQEVLSRLIEASDRAA